MSDALTTGRGPLAFPIRTDHPEAVDHAVEEIDSWFTVHAK